MDTALNQHVLVLNRLWQAVNVCSVKRAISLLYAGHAQVVDAESGSFQTFDFQQWRDFANVQDEHGDHVIQTVRFRIRIPKVIVLLLFDKLPRKDVKLTRQNVFERDQFTCQYCGNKFDRKDLNLDHVIPRDKGGQTSWENIVCSCIRCNTKKGNLLVHQAGMKLVRRPRKPKFRPFLSVQLGRNPHESWRHFLDFAYWNVELSD